MERELFTGMTPKSKTMMQPEITYKATAADLREILLEPLRREVVAEYKAHFNQRIVDVEIVALIHDVSVQTVRSYAKAGDIPTEPRLDTAPFKFRLGNALEFDFKALRKQAILKR